MATPRITFYDNNTGYVSYLSNVADIAGTEMRVLDAVEQLSDCSQATVRFLPETLPDRYNVMGEDFPKAVLAAMAHEAIAVAAKAQVWLNRRILSGPYNSAKWKRTGRKEHLAAVFKRRQALRSVK